MTGVDTTFLLQLELVEAPLHAAAHEFLKREILTTTEELAIVPQVLCEFIHVATDPRRFTRPLTVDQAIAKAHFWWNARQTRQILPTAAATDLFLSWLAQFQLGRKRLLDTQLAAILWTAGVRRLFTSNPRDFTLFGFHVLSP